VPRRKSLFLLGAEKDKKLLPIDKLGMLP